MRAVLTLLLALASAACAAGLPVEPIVQAEPGEPFTLAVGQEAVLGEGALRVRFEEVGEDSRCPVAVVCVWQGNARVRLRLGGTGDGSRLVDVNTGVEPRSAAALGHRVELLELDPQPTEAGPPRPASYTARLRLVAEP